MLDIPARRTLAFGRVGGWETEIFHDHPIDIRTPLVGHSPHCHSAVRVAKHTPVTYRGPTSHQKEMNRYGNTD